MSAMGQQQTSKLSNAHPQPLLAKLILLSGWKEPRRAMLQNLINWFGRGEPQLNCRYVVSCG